MTKTDAGRSLFLDRQHSLAQILQLGNDVAYLGPVRNRALVLPGDGAVGVHDKDGRVRETRLVVDAIGSCNISLHVVQERERIALGPCRQGGP